MSFQELHWLSVIVSPQNSIRLLTRAQLVEIFTGKYDTWRQIGGKLHKQILPLLDREIYEKLWPSELMLSPRTLLLDRLVLNRAVVRQAGAIGLTLCKISSIRKVKVIGIQGRKRTGRWKNWPVSWSVPSYQKFLRGFLESNLQQPALSP